MSEQPQPYNAENPKHIRSRKRKEDREKERDQEARRFVMSDPRGRHFVWLVVSEAGMFKQPFTRDARTDFNCGRLDVGIWLHKSLSEEFPGDYVNMWREHQEIQAREKKLDEAARTESAQGESDG